jgi:hypothetical protein
MVKMKPLFALIFAFSGLLPGLSAQVRNSQPPITITWMPNVSMPDLDGTPRTFFAFKGAQYNAGESMLPFYYEKIRLNGNPGSVNVTLTDAVFIPLTPAEKTLVEGYGKASRPGNSVDPVVKIGYIKKESYALVQFYPFRKNESTGAYEKLASFRLVVTPGSGQRLANVTQTYASNSVLASGTWYKVGVVSDGIYKLSYSFLKNMGMDLASIDPNTVKVYGNGGGQLPYANSAPRRDDLAENSVYVYDGITPGVFDSTDYILFYGQSPNRWKGNTGGCIPFRHVMDLFSDTTFYFITYGAAPSKKVMPQASSTLPNNRTVTSFDDYGFHESDATNLIKSGREWYGEKFDILNSYTFNFNFPNIDPSIPGYVRTEVLGHADVSSTFVVTCGNGSATLNTQATQTSVYYNPYGYSDNRCFSFTPSTANVSITVARTSPTSNQDWTGFLNYVEVNVHRLLSMTGDQLLFRDSLSTGPGNISKFILSNASSAVTIWDVTDPTNAMQQVTAPNGSNLEFTLPTDTLKEFVAFTGLSFLTPVYSGSVPNQNLHAYGPTDLIIVAPPVFWNEATALAQHHNAVDGLSVVVVTPQQIYNEFSSGAVDATAIRDFVRMFYKRAQNNSELPQYLLLYGDGSYDNKTRFVNNTNFIPTYQSVNSTDPIKSYVSDDFFVLLDDSEGNWAPSDPDQPDAGVGRLPVKSVSESQTALAKILKYSTAPGFIEQNNMPSCSNTGTCSVYGDWRNTITFMADDEDNDIHLVQAEALANFVDTTYDNYNVDKIYFDSYLQVATPGGDRYPDVVSAIDKRMEKGCLIFNYTGHGGEVGLGHERVIEVSQINSWKNLCNMPLFFTATCEFSRWDDPERTSAGEYCFLNPDGGAIGLMSTVRLVFSQPNFTLNYNFYQYSLDTLAGGRYPRLGDLNMLTKSTIAPDENNRNFTLLCDPAITLAYPRQRIVTKTVNSNPVNMSQPDTINALSTVTITGEVDDLSGNKITTFNGLVYPTVYDKPASITTLSNDAGSPPYTFKLQKNILYKGKVSVVNGDFTFTFVVPKDIAYQFGFGRVSYYGHDGNVDAQGNYENLVIGGTNVNAPADITGPEIKLYMNDDKFAFGGMTNENPEIYAVINDSNGVNTVGNGIGHDITATLDGNTSNEIVLNDYYVADLNSYKQGRIRYQLSALSPGTHNVKLKVWDVYNNSNFAYTEFLVAQSASLALDHVLNYPNPFTTHTQFFFEQNQCCTSLDVQVQIYTVSGKLVKTINTTQYAEGFRSDGIDWDGLDDYGDQIGRGVYVYRVKIRNDQGETADKYERLVILK